MTDAEYDDLWETNEWPRNTAPEPARPKARPASTGRSLPVAEQAEPPADVLNPFGHEKYDDRSDS